MLIQGKWLDYSKIHLRDVKKDLQQFGKKKILVAPLHGPQIAIFVFFFVFFGVKYPFFGWWEHTLPTLRKVKSKEEFIYAVKKLKNTVFHAQKAQKPCFIAFLGL